MESRLPCIIEWGFIIILYVFFCNKKIVVTLIEKCGFKARVNGNLRTACEIENIPLRNFPEWQRPMLISFILWWFCYFCEFGRQYICVSDLVTVGNETTLVFYYGFDPTNIQHMLMEVKSE